ncbi:hypothetical protein BC835DRAFT_1384192 [Cytidiella melzeri]|nr:hypothetical protein BC835DRAFT_1384192 [Cytidiella melzeri]
MIANHTTSTSCLSECRCGADLTNAVHYAREDVNACDKRLIELRNSGVSEDEVQQAQEARHVAQERYDAAFKAFMDFSNNNPMRIASVDDEEALTSDDEDDMSSEEDGDEDEDEDEDIAVGNVHALAGGEDDDDYDDEEDEDYKP